MTLRLPRVRIRATAAAAGSAAAGNSSGDAARAAAASGFRARRVAAPGEDFRSLAAKALASLPEGALEGVRGVVAATYSFPDRFPTLAAFACEAARLKPDSPCVDLQSACSAYPYALWTAAHMSLDTGARVLVLDGDVQSPFCEGADGSTAALFSDAVCASVVECRRDGAPESPFAFLTRPSRALACPAAGPLEMDGFAVFSFVATEAAPFLAAFVDEAGGPGAFDFFVPHQANMYMVRRLAKDLGLSAKLATCGEDLANPGSCSVPSALARGLARGRCLLAGFGAGLSAAACIADVDPPAGMR